MAGMQSAQADTHTWTNKVTGAQDWSTAGNWSGGVYVSDPANELMFFADVNALPSSGIKTITSVPAALSMNTLTLNGMSPNNINGYTIIFGDGTSVWTIGDGTTSTINLNAKQWSFDYRSVFYHPPNIRFNQAITTITGNGSGGGFYFEGNITETAPGYGITKSGNSRAMFFGTNTYSGPTTVSGGILRLSSASALPGGTGVSGGTSALTLNGGVLELATGDFQRGLGTAGNQFQIIGGTSGFSAKGAPRYVTVNNDAAQELVWGSTTFQPTALVLNSASATREADKCDNNLTLCNKLDLNGATRTVQVNAYTAFIPSDIQTSSGTAGLTKTGNGTLVLSGANTYNGPTTISGGALSMGATNNLGDGGNLIFNSGTLQITGTSITNIASIGHAVTFNSGTKGFDIHDAANTFTVDQVLNQGSGYFYKYGAGTLVLNQANTFTGESWMTGGGTLVLDYSTEDNSKLSATQELRCNGGALTLSGGSYTQVVSATTLGHYTGSFITRSSGTATINLNAINSSWRDGVDSALSLSEAGIATTDRLNIGSGILGAWATVGSHWTVNSINGAS